jgi:hypothetical protein
MKFASMFFKCFVIGIVGVSALQGAQTPEKRSGQEKSLFGLLASVDAQKQIITVKMKSKDYPIGIQPATQIHNGSGVKLSLAELKTNTPVAVNYRKNPDGTRTAISVEQRLSVQAAAEKTTVKKEEPGVIPGANVQKTKVGKPESTKPVTPAQPEKTSSPAKTEPVAQPQSAGTTVKPAPTAVAPAATTPKPASDQKATPVAPSAQEQKAVTPAPEAKPAGTAAAKPDSSAAKPAATPVKKESTKQPAPTNK